VEVEDQEEALHTTKQVLVVLESLVKDMQGGMVVEVIIMAVAVAVLVQLVQMQMVQVDNQVVLVEQDYQVQ
jgi:hypothetical protein